LPRIALTGTPGVGKTTLAREAQAAGWRVVDVKAWAEAQGCVAGYDELDQAAAIDVERLGGLVPADDGSKVLYEGHLSHLLPLDGAWVLRCDPALLAPRLRARGYPEGKVRENVEAEAIDLILQEALGQLGPHVRQRDATARTPKGLWAAFAGGPGVEALRRPDLEAVDWTDRL